MSIDLALLILRVIVGGLFIGHGAQKLFGWFGGFGMAGFTGWLASTGLKPARLWALTGALSEFGGGLLLVLGLLNPLGPLALIGAMLMAIVMVHWEHGLWATNNGIEYPLVLLIVSAVMGLVGPGTLSLDTLLSISLPVTLTFWGGLLAIVAVNVLALTQTRQAKAQVGQTA